MNLFKIAARVATSDPSSMVDMELISASIVHPSDMVVDEIINRAKKLFPCDVGEITVEQTEEGIISVLVSCPVSFYDSSEDYNEYGPDDAGVEVVWEKP